MKRLNEYENLFRQEIQIIHKRSVLITKLCHAVLLAAQPSCQSSGRDPICCGTSSPFEGAADAWVGRSGLGHAAHGSPCAVMCMRGGCPCSLPLLLRPARHIYLQASRPASPGQNSCEGSRASLHPSVLPAMLRAHTGCTLLSVSRRAVKQALRVLVPFRRVY